MNALKQSVRPKHQVLILKCYPKLPKNTTQADIKPNGSELAYLLYYASSRRSKLTKVGTFLERKTSADLHKGRTPNVLITLQILTAVLGSKEIVKVESFGLIAPFVLRILRETLGHGSDLALLEQALPVWDAFCRHQDHASLSADTAYRNLFEQVVKAWAAYAENKKTGIERGRTGAGATGAIRRRRAGLQAIKSISASEALNSELGRQLNVILPVILQNLYRDGEAGYLNVLQAKEMELEAQREVYRGRPSIATVRTVEEGDSKAARGSAAEADLLDEEETGLLAMQCLKRIFATDNRGQVRTATIALLRFITSHKSPQRTSEKGTLLKDAWSMELFETVCGWTPVQDRFVVLFTAVGTLVGSPIVEEELGKQLVLAHLVSHVLGSDINLIGLSVMDVLLGLIQHILLILQLGTSSTKLSSIIRRPQGPVMEVVKSASNERIQLLQQLRLCIANLATHIYYTDQIEDMVSAILLRLKPSPAATDNPAITAAAIEDPTSAAAEVASNVSLRERPNTDGFFSFDTAREVALGAVKDIFIVAHSTSSPTASNRNSVPNSVWEGTQWLLRDPSSDVRRAYIDALCTCLRLEAIKSDLKLEEDRHPVVKEKKNYEGSLARRAASTASRHRASKKRQSTFLQLLHLAVYDEILQRAEVTVSDADVLSFHLLLTTLVQKLGINAVRIGLPMMFRLQDDIELIQSPAAKVKVGTLVYAYFWALSEMFDFEHAAPGRDIQSEIARRQQQGLWVDNVRMPPLPIEQIAAASAARTASTLSNAAAEPGALQPFSQREQVAERIADAYSAFVSSPPASAPGSPGRSFSLPALSVEANSYLNARPSTANSKHTLPQHVRDELLSSWSKDALLAALAAAAPKSASVSGSRTGRSLTSNLALTTASPLLAGDHRRMLGVANTFPMNHSPKASGSLPTSPSRAGNGNGKGRSRLASASGSPAPAPAPALALAPQAVGRRPSTTTTATDAHSTGTAGNTRRVEELKAVLATAAAGGGVGLGLGGAGRFDDDTASESLVDAEEGEYDDSVDATPPEEKTARLAGNEGVEARDLAVEMTPKLQVREPADGATQGGVGEGRNGGLGGSLARGARSRSRAGTTGGRKDLGDLLRGIEVGEVQEEREGMEAGTGGFVRPPY
ncbi:plasma membrane localization protein [Taxawa tesnikishii (nom. ined.)]|nr:plasma membrane localization protein [Dothideales sp. JES 119]